MSRKSWCWYITGTRARAGPRNYPKLLRRKIWRSPKGHVSRSTPAAGAFSCTSMAPRPRSTPRTSTTTRTESVGSPTPSVSEGSALLCHRRRAGGHAGPCWSVLARGLRQQGRQYPVFLKPFERACRDRDNAHAVTNRPAFRGRWGELETWRRGCAMCGRGAHASGPALH
jgi:hypothetical protein